MSCNTEGYDPVHEYPELIACKPTLGFWQQLDQMTGAPKHSFSVDESGVLMKLMAKYCASLEN